LAVAVASALAAAGVSVVEGDSEVWAVIAPRCALSEGVDDGSGRGVIVIVYCYDQGIASALRREGEVSDLWPSWIPSLNLDSIEGKFVETSGSDS
jgi:hypothetical protein